MSRYNPVERKVAALLNWHPSVKRGVKRAYQRVNYRLFGDSEFTHDTHPDVELVSASEWFDVADAGRERFVGYYDVSPWNEAMTAGLFHEPIDSGRVAIAVYSDGTRTTIANSSVWNYQQGSRAQWHPTRQDCLLFNDVEDDTVVTRLATTAGDIERTYVRPIQAVCPTGEKYISLNYRRLDRNRPDYGYGTDDGSPLEAPGGDGLWLVDMDTGEDDLVISLQSLIEVTDATPRLDDHYVNHALYDPTGNRVAFLHRWEGEAGRTSRLYVTDCDGNRELLLDDRVVSHYCWIDENHLFVWGRSEEFGHGYHIIDAETGALSYVDALDEWGDGHPSLSPDGRYVVTDTYPDRKRQRHLLLYDRKTGEVTELGRFFEPLQYTGETRCDLHPRWSPDGTAISFDSTHTGRRGSYVLDVSQIVD